MSTKRKLSLSTPQPVKKERKVIDLDIKIIVDELSTKEESECDHTRSEAITLYCDNAFERQGKNVKVKGSCERI